MFTLDQIKFIHEMKLKSLLSEMRELFQQHLEIECEEKLSKKTLGGMHGFEIRQGPSPGRYVAGVYRVRHDAKFPDTRH